MPPYVAHSNAHSHQGAAHKSIVPSSPQASSENGIEQPQPSEEGTFAASPYLRGFLDGLAAANANADNHIFEATASSSAKNPNTSWPSMANLSPPMSFQTFGGPDPHPRNLHLTYGGSSSLPPEESSFDDQLHEWLASEADLLPGATGPGFYNDLFVSDVSTLAAYSTSVAIPSCIEGLDENRTSSAHQLPLASNHNVPPGFRPPPALDQFQLNGPTLNELQSFAVEKYESHGVSSLKSASNPDQMLSALSTHALLTNELGSINQSAIPCDLEVSPTREVNVDELALFPTALPQPAIKRSKHHKTPSVIVCVCFNLWLRLYLHTPSYHQSRRREMPTAMLIWFSEPMEREDQDSASNQESVPPSPGN